MMRVSPGTRNIRNLCQQKLIRMHLLAVIVTGSLICLSAPLASAEDWGPWETKQSSPQPRLRADINPLDQAVNFFQKYISPVDGARCPMYPTCSAYARQALHKHGPLLGIFMTADRLIHEGDPIEQQEPILKWGYRRYFDPLTYNDFWFDSNQD
jgi:putative component of membrane protein insertase Oxa1/YidC/SpoIIIJ protein YidD